MSLIMINIRVDSRMKQAIEKVAKKEFSSVSGIIKYFSQIEGVGTDSPNNKDIRQNT
jgi:hypothetical protein